MKPKKKMNNKKIMIICIAILLILIIINVITKLVFKEEQELSKEAVLAKQETETIINNLSKENEIDRIETYLSDFIGKIENQNWTDAYEILYDEFKNNYFSSEDSFKKYCDLYFPKMIDITVENIERVNNIYVLETKINDLVNGNLNDGQISLYFVIRENALNDFDLSFSVNSAIDAKNN